MTGSDRVYVLQTRDVALLKFLSEFRVADREQLKRAVGFGSRTRVNFRLLALVRMGLLNRVFIGNSGASRKAVYMLTKKGAAAGDVQYRRVRLLENSLTGLDLALGHQLRLNDAFLSIREAPLTVKIANWKTFDRPLSPTVRLKPDGYFEYTAEVTRPAFLEVDMGTETKRIWAQKIREYLRLAVSGEFTNIFGQQHFRTLIVAPSERRLENILRVVAEHTDKIFFGTTFASISESSFWNPIWLRPGRSDRVSLL